MRNQRVLRSGIVLLGMLAAACAEQTVQGQGGGSTFASAGGGFGSPAGSGVGSHGLRGANVEYITAASASPAGLPPNAKPGECYVRVVIPARYDTVSERVLRKAASTRVETVPAEFAAGQERVLVKNATRRLEVVPATYEEVEERVLVRPASKRLEPIPATYRTVNERVLVRPAYQVWKRSSELTAAERARQNIPADAGDILCFVEMPAEYRTVTREIVDRPATTREVVVPAEYTTVRKTVQKTPPTTREIVEPAEYSTVSVQKMVTPAREVRTEIPAEYDTVSRQVLRAPATAEWRQVLCETNATAETLSRIQRALRAAGFDPGRDDGRVDERTMSAVRAFQQARNLPVDNDRYINMATVRQLGLRA